jgi:uncharacterized protein with GYD domain
MQRAQVAARTATNPTEKRHDRHHGRASALDPHPDAVLLKLRNERNNPRLAILVQAMPAFSKRQPQTEISSTVRRSTMPSYITLVSFTDQGARTVKDTVNRADAVKELASRFGVTMKSIHWTLGQYDLVASFEAKDDASITALGLALTTQGNVRTQTLKAFTREEMADIVSRI